jgi:DNA-binding transcriptional LysR family regulator
MNQNALDGLLALRLVADKRNFTAAAAELDISPPAISKIIKLLERRLGVALLSRTTRSTSLTEAGERFLNQAGPAVDQILAAIKDLGTYASKPSGLLRLNLPLFSYSSYLAPRIASFLMRYPEVSVELFFEDAATDVVEKGFDAGIRDSDILAKDMVAIKLFGPIRFVIVGAPKYFKRKGRPKHPEELLSHDCIRVRVDAGWIYDRWEFEQYAPSSDGYYLYYPRRSQVQPKLRAFIEHLQKAKAQSLPL